MARQARKLSKSGNYYVELKGDELFVTDDDKKKFMEILYGQFEDGRVYETDLDKTSIHLAIKEGGRGISMIMKSVTTRYARYFNRANNREGKLFADRFASEPLETEEELDECIRRIKSNVRAKPAKKREAGKEKKKKAAADIKTAVRTEKKEEIKRQTRRNNLPSWLL